ncbi:Uncharacterized protein OBRU01_20829 [Operophtera brumata]|uniref:Uncharacterized protein n=1 Tax=Operophtera brumata TaxID=104452 RepID=A0A0L7KTY7_OPEBR|nr:Uncharacterized protein OBRU01_20829 [Operophtera brumata]
MFVKGGDCYLSHKMYIRLNNFLYIFNLRQGCILIAVHQIALSSFILIILLVGISHVGEMLSMLHNDMEDDAERRGFYEVAYGDTLTFHEGDVLSTNNQRRFAKAQHLASGECFYEVAYGDTITFHEGDVLSTNNQRRFAKAQHLASVTVIVLYTSTILTSIYLMCCISLLHGAVQYKREYVVPWICAACVAAVLLVAACVAADNYPTLINFFNGHTIYPW